MKTNNNLILKEVAMPKDTNWFGDIFGGWILSKMDIAGGVLARSVSPTTRAVTIGIEKMSFLKPIHVGELVSVYAKIVGYGNTSIKVEIEAWSYSPISREEHKVTEGIFTFVAINEDREPVTISRLPNN
jgi:acyl-CoA thioesterase YciA